MYDYLWVYTSAQIELMNIDAPFIAYKKKDKKENTPDGEEATKESCEDAVKRWQERKKKRKFKLDDFLKIESDKPEEQKETKTEITE